MSQPSTDCQIAGRVNRFENKPDAEIHFIHHEDSEDFFNEKRAEFKEIHKRWKTHILSFIQDHEGKFVSIRTMMESYDNFWNKDNNDNINESLKILEKQNKNAIEVLNRYIPKRLFHGEKIKTSSLNSLFRGDSKYLSACVVDDKGSPINQLQDDDLLNESRPWYINKIERAMTNCLRTIDKCNKSNKVNNHEVFDYKKYIEIFGFKTERPLICSHIDEEIDQCLSKNLSNEDNNLTDHRVYHKRFGLVKKDLLKK